MLIDVRIKTSLNKNKETTYNKKLHILYKSPETARHIFIHGWRKYWIIHRVGGPTYAARSKPQYISAFATRVLQSTYVYVRGNRAWARILKLFRTPGISSTKLADWEPFIFLLYLHYYICRRNWFLGNFCTSWKFKNLGSGELCMSYTQHFHWLLVV